MVRITDVAKHAGVSPSTVSYALSGKRSIRADTRLRIDAAVRDLGYRANAGARMLAGTRTNILALSAPMHAETHPPAFMSFVVAIATAARRHDYDILLLTEGGPFFDTTVYALYIYRRAFESGQYAYGAALAMFLIVIGIVVALLGWRLFDMRQLLQRPRIEVH